jgi:hypothetical protein
MGVQNEKTAKMRRLDIIVISAILLLALLLLLVTELTKKEGAVAVVEVDGTVVGEYPLAIGGEFSLNGGTNTLVIEGGKAYLSYASCPDRVCVIRGKIGYVGESIICLPNRLSVTVKGNADGGVDFVS